MAAPQEHAARPASATAPLPRTTTIKSASLRKAWNHRFDEYRRLKALMEAVFEFGEVRDVENTCDLLRYELERKHGSVAAAQRAGDDAAFREAFNALTAMEDRLYKEYTEPSDLAAVALVLTPAPDLDAAIAKIDIIRDRELWNFTGMVDDPFKIVEADMARLASKPGAPV